MRKIKNVMLLLIVLTVALFVFAACSGVKINNKPKQQQLNAPVINIDDDGIVTWSAVDGANRYIVFVNGERETVVQTTSYKVVRSTLGTYEITVKATDSLGNKLESKDSNTVQYIVSKTALMAPTLQLDLYDVTWAPVQGATGYLIYINDELVENAEIKEVSGVMQFTFTEEEYGEYSICVVATDSTETYKDSAKSSAVTVHVLEPDDSAVWVRETFKSNWKGATGTAIAQGYSVVAANSGDGAEIENYVVVPTNCQYFKIAFMRFSDDMANPQVYIYTRGANERDYTLMHAVGIEEDYVSTPEVNKTYGYVYDFTELSENVYVKIVVKSADTSKNAQAAFTAVGFTDHDGTTEHTTSMTEWNKGELLLDWNFNNATGWIMGEGGEQGVLALYINGTMTNTIAVTEETKYLNVESTVGLKVTVDGEPVDMANDGTTYIYNLSSYVGETITVVVTATELTSIASANLSAQSTILMTPTLQLDLYDVTWVPVQGATDYLVYINGELDEDAEVVEQSGVMKYTFTEEEYGEYLICVVATDSTEKYKNSAKSAAVTVRVLEPDDSAVWVRETFKQNWKGTVGNEIAQGYSIVAVGNGSDAVIENYVVVPTNSQHFKIAFMRFSDDMADPKVYIYTHGSNERDYTLVKAVGVDEDYVTTPEVNKMYGYVYDFSELSENVYVKIVVKSADTSKNAQAAFTAVGFTDHDGTTEHTTSMTEWNKGELLLDWNFNNATGWIMGEGGEQGVPALYFNGTMTNTIAVTEETKYLNIKSTVGLKVTVGNSVVEMVKDGTINTYNLSSYVGETITVVATATELTSIASANLSAQSTILMTPTLQLDLYDVTWAPVQGATGYLVYVNNVLVENAKIEEVSGVMKFTFTEEEYGEYSICVVATDSTETYKDSAKSSAVTVRVLEPDDSAVWVRETFKQNWKGTVGNEIAQGYSVVTANSGDGVEIENYVVVPTNCQYFKIAFMRFNDDNADPKVYIYTRGANERDYTLVKAVGTVEDYVSTPEVNKTYGYVYDFTDMPENVYVKIVVKSADTSKNAQAAFSVAGFTDRADVGLQATAKTEWDKGDLMVDWSFNNATGWVMGDNQGVLNLYGGGTMTNTIAVTEETKYLNFVSSAGLLVTVDGEPVYTTSDGTTYTYYLNSYVGETITVIATASDLTAIISANLAAQSDMPTVTDWDDIGLLSWQQIGGASALHGAGFNIQLDANATEAKGISTMIYVPKDRTKLGIYALAYGPDANTIANMVVKVKMAGGEFIAVRAEGEQTNHKHLVGAGYLCSLITYDLSEYAGSIITVQITNERIEQSETTVSPLVLQAVGVISAEGTSILNSWNKAQVSLDWATQNCTAWSDGVQGGLLTLYENGTLQNTIKITEDATTFTLNSNQAATVTVDDTELTATEDGNNRSYDLSAYVGQTVTVKITGRAGLTFVYSAQLN